MSDPWINLYQDEHDVCHVNIAGVDYTATDVARRLAAYDALLETLEMSVHFEERGYNRNAAWSFVGGDAEHPAWYAFTVHGASGLQDWVKCRTRAAIAATRGER